MKYQKDMTCLCSDWCKKLPSYIGWLKGKAERFDVEIERLQFKVEYLENAIISLESKKSIQLPLNFLLFTIGAIIGNSFELGPLWVLEAFVFCWILDLWI